MSFEAYTGLRASQQAIKDGHNNLANLNTNGYKKLNSFFYDLPYKDEHRIGEGEKAIGLMQKGTGVAIGGTSSDFSSGDVVQTKGNDFNTAISGNGFFVITKPDGSIAYSRNGQFMKDSEGMIVTLGSGYQVGQQAINIPDAGATEFTIKEDGSVTAKIGDATQDLGRIELANFINPNGLKRIGQNLYEESEGSGAPIFSYPGEEGMGFIKQGYVERSNVDPILSLLEVVEALHWNGFNQKAFEIYSEVMKKATEVRV